MAAIAASAAAAATAVAVSALRARSVPEAVVVEPEAPAVKLVVLLSCQEIESSVAQGWSEVFGPSAMDDAHLWSALEKACVPFARLVWNDPATLTKVAAAVKAGGCLILARQPWDYSDSPAALAAFQAFLKAAAQAGAKLWNSQEVLVWNSHKRYIPQLQEAGVPTVPTVYAAPKSVEGSTQVTVASALAALPATSGLIIKPAVGASARGVVLVEDLTDDAAIAAADAYLAVAGGWASPEQSTMATGLGPGKWSGEEEPLLVQPFMPSIRTYGEMSVLVVRGHVTHATVKLPAGATGEFKVQPEYGGVDMPTTLPPDMHHFVHSLLQLGVTLAKGGEGTFTVTPSGHDYASDIAYARVDLVRLDDTNAPGSVRLMELEAVEPEMFWRHSAGAVQRLADGVSEWYHSEQ